MLKTISLSFSFVLTCVPLLSDDSVSKAPRRQQQVDRVTAERRRLEVIMLKPSAEQRKRQKPRKEPIAGELVKADVAAQKTEDDKEKAECVRIATEKYKEVERILGAPPTPRPDHREVWINDEARQIELNRFLDKR